MRDAEKVLRLLEKLQERSPFLCPICSSVVVITASPLFTVQVPEKKAGAEGLDLSTLSLALEVLLTSLGSDIAQSRRKVSPKLKEEIQNLLQALEQKTSSQASESSRLSGEEILEPLIRALKFLQELISLKEKEAQQNLKQEDGKSGLNGSSSPPFNLLRSRLSVNSKEKPEGEV